jgi:hypothetical protein
MTAWIDVTSWFDFAVEHFITFALGLTAGFLLSNRFKLVRRNGDDKMDDEMTGNEPGNDEQLAQEGVSEEEVSLPVEDDDEHRRREEEIIERQTPVDDPGEDHEDRPPVDPEPEDSPPVQAPDTMPPQNPGGTNAPE